ncbi:MAG: UDP-2,3-diacylglucosamine diphosphatase LpxI [Pseudomonadota bacterium]|nr:UDP-2,3-diacylglucosamine diphosphatase LpxI [Pseudomonadota bacterium]MEE3101346.1 UDP-2,3-diacylglucosamine diphosphatase LpxI [Pseudomonadota bacterium]
MTETGGALALVAGAGDLPRLIAEDRRRRGLGLLVVRFEGVHAPWAEGMDVLDVPFEKPGRLFKAMKAKGCDRVCFAGGMTRPKLDPLRFDLKALSIAVKAVALLKKGDDAMLRGFASIFEGEGYAMVAPHDLLSGLLAPEGVLGAVRPTDQDREDAARAAAVVAAMGAVDVGQAAVIRDGVCLGVEAVAGTDALLDEVARLPAGLRHGEAKGVLMKAPKPGQDWRMDLPAIGPETVRRAALAGLGGICVQSGSVLVLGLDETLRAADEAGLFLWGRPDGPDALSAETPPAS